MAAKLDVNKQNIMRAINWIIKNGLPWSAKSFSVR